MSHYLTYIVSALATAFVFEIIANTVGDGSLFMHPHWPFVFLVWYTALYSILYLFTRNQPLAVGVIGFACFGVVAEILVFQRSNLIVDPLIYAAMAAIPMVLHQRRVAPAP